MPNLEFWKEPFPNESIEEGKQLVQRLHWNLTVSEKDGIWRVHSGHVLLLKTTCEEAVEALLYGLALSHVVMPERIFSELKKIADHDAFGSSSPE